MKIGIIVDGHSSPAEIAEWARLAERYELDQFWTPTGLRTPDNLIRLSVAALATSRIRLGTMSLGPFDMHPVRIGTAILTLNELTAGRAAIMIGPGGHLTSTYAIVRERPVRATRECVEVIKLMASGKAVDYRGKIFSVDLPALPWVRSSSPLIYVSANRPQMLKMAAKAADGIMLSDMPAGMVGSLLSRIKEYRGDNAPIRLSNYFVWNVQETLAEAYRLAKRNLAFRLFYVRDFGEFIGLTASEIELLERNQAVFLRALSKGFPLPDIPESTVRKLVEGVTISGSVKDLEQSVERLHEFERAGLNEIALDLHGNKQRAIELLGKKVIPQFTRR